jgi:hypothetical protein
VVGHGAAMEAAIAKNMMRRRILKNPKPFCLSQ